MRYSQNTVFKKACTQAIKKITKYLISLILTLAYMKRLKLNTHFRLVVSFGEEPARNWLLQCFQIHCGYGRIA